MREKEALFDCFVIIDGGKHASKAILTKGNLERIADAGGLDYTLVTFGKNSEYSNNPADEGGPTYITDAFIPAVFNLEISLN